MGIGGRGVRGRGRGVSGESGAGAVRKVLFRLWDNGHLSIEPVKDIQRFRNNLQTRTHTHTHECPYTHKLFSQPVHNYTAGGWNTLTGTGTIT